MVKTHMHRCMRMHKGGERGLWMVLWTDHITSSHMYFRGPKPDMHAIVILNHRLGKLDPRSRESLTQREFRRGRYRDRLGHRARRCIMI